MSLWLARHAKPLLASGTCYGVLDVPADVALTEAAAQALAAELPSGVQVQVSPLMRCQQLGQALATLRPDLQFSTEPHLREMDFGCWEGVSWDAIPRTAVEDWTADFARHRFGGRESANDILARVAQVWDALAPDTDTLWICHAGVVHAAMLLQQNRRTVASAEDWPSAGLAFGAWLKL